VGLASTGWTRAAAALSLVALIAITVSDFTLTHFWDENAMVTSVVADILVLVVGVAVVNEFLTARSRRRWQLVAEYALVELSSCCRRVWVNLAEEVGVGRRADLTRDDFRDLVVSTRQERRLVDFAHEAARNPDARRSLQSVISELVATTRDALANWSPLLIETPYAGAVSRYVEMQALLARVDLVLWEETEGKRASYEGTGDPEWIALRLASLIALAAELELELHHASAEMEIRAPVAG
jgi:hypothetical protein